MSDFYLLPTLPYSKCHIGCIPGNEFAFLESSNSLFQLLQATTRNAEQIL